MYFRDWLKNVNSDYGQIFVIRSSCRCLLNTCYSNNHSLISKRLEWKLLTEYFKVFTRKKKRNTDLVVHRVLISSIGQSLYPVYVDRRWYKKKHEHRFLVFVVFMRGPWGRSLVRGVPMREQRIVKHTLNSVIDILNLTPLFTVFSLKCDHTLSSVVN